MTNVHKVVNHPTAIIHKTAQAGCDIGQKGMQELKPLSSTQPRVHIHERHLKRAVYIERHTKECAISADATETIIVGKGAHQKGF